MSATTHLGETPTTQPSGAPSQPAAVARSREPLPGITPNGNPSSTVTDRSSWSVPIELSEIIDVPAIQSLMDNLYAIVQVPLAILDMHGTVLVANGWQDICTRFHRVNPESCRHCLESDLILSNGVPPGTFRRYRCKNGMWDMATPIMVGDVKVGNLYIGQFFPEGEIADVETFRRQAQKYGFDEGEYLAALEQVPHMSPEKIEAASSFFADFSRLVSHLGHSNVNLAKAIAEQESLMEKLRRGDKNYRYLLEHAADAVFVIQNDRTQFVNQRVEQLSGLSRGELVSAPFSGFIHPDDRERIVERYRRRLSGEEVEAREPFRVLGANGRVAWVDIHASIVDWEGQPAALVFLTDVTERKRTEDALAQRERDFASLADHLPDLVTRFDTQFRHIYANRAVSALTGVPQDQVVGRRISEMPLPAANAEAVDRSLATVLSTGNDYVSESAWHMPSGLMYLQTHVVPERDESGQIVSMLAISRDITQHKRAMDLLAEQRELLDYVIRHDPNAIAVYDEQMRFIFVSERFLEIHGLRQEDVIGKRHRDIFPEIPERWQGLYDRVLAGAIEGSEDDWFEAPDGSIQNISWQCRPWYRGDGHIGGVITFTEVTTPRKQAEMALRESQSRLAESNELLTAVLKYTHLMAAYYDADFNFIWINDAYAEAMGHAPDFYPGKNRFDLFPDPDARPIFERVRDTGQSISVANYRAAESLFPAIGGTYWDWSLFPVKDADDRTIGLVSTMVDVTDLAKMEEMARRNANEVQWMLKSMTNAFAVLDSVFDEQGAFTGCRLFFINDACARMTGESDEQVHNQLVSDVWPATDPAWIRACGEVAVTGAPRLFQMVLGAAGRLCRGNIYRPGDSPDRICVVFEDITDQKQAEEERERLQSQLQQAQKMEAVGRLAGGVAHDFNNMLTAIMGYATLALDTVERGTILHKSLEEIETAAKRSADLTRQLLAFARRQTAAPELLDLNETVAGTLQMLRRLIGEDIRLVWVPGRGLWRVQIDPSQIDQLLANLSVNARDAIAGVGEIVIETKNAALDEAYCAEHPGFLPGEYVCLSVTDTGQGMDQETLSHIFEPFFTTKAMGEGTGLGLATVYGVVSQNSGFINVRSQIGLGTTFEIFLPRSLEETGQTHAPESRSVALRGGTETILFVEDEKALLELGETILRRLGYTVLSALSPREALVLAHQYEGQISLLVTDVVMPEMNGRQLAERILSLQPNVKVLYTSGYTADVIAVRGVLDHDVNFIQKPFVLKTLAAKVRQVLES